MGGKRDDKESSDRRNLNRQHGSTAFFVMVDYMFIFIFFCFLCYFLAKILPGFNLLLLMALFQRN